MKTRKISISALLALALLTAGCDSYLDTENTKEPPAYDLLTDVEALRATTANLYTSPWYFFHKMRFIQMGDARANNLYISTSSSNDYNAQATFNDTRITSSIANAWGSLYNVITQSAYIIDDYVPFCISNNICSEEDARACEGEARFMTALAYWYLGMYWHDVPIVENATTISTQAYANRFEDVIKYSIYQAEKAAAMLPETACEKGRVTKTSANALLSRLYLTAADYAKGGHMQDDNYYTKAAEAAKAALRDGNYGLMDDYEQIFRVQNNNCKEVLFALQFVQKSATTGLANDISGLCYDRCLNQNFGQLAYSTWASYDFLYVAGQRGGLKRTRANVMPTGMTYDYLFHEIDTCADYGKTWTVGRRSQLPIKKHVVGGSIATDGLATNGNTGFNTPFLRMSEVYLNLTEALMGQLGVDETRDEGILQYINKVRRRAYKYELENAPEAYVGDYKTINMDSILQERRMEFFAEGLFWTDIVRRSFRGAADLQHMIDYNNNKLYEQNSDHIMGCHRLYSYTYTPNEDTNRLGTVKLSTNSDGSYRISVNARQCVHNIPEGSYCHSDAVAVADNLWSMIYPPTEVSQNPNLNKAPVAFDFSKLK